VAHRLRLVEKPIFTQEQKNRHREERRDAAISLLLTDIIDE